MKRFLTILFMLCLASATALSAGATDDSRAYDFNLSVNGEHEITAKCGDVLTVTLHLRRTDRTESAPMYAMQTELEYDGSFFRLVDRSGISAPGVETRDLALRNNRRSYYVNFVSVSGGVPWEEDTLAASFQLEVIGSEGASSIENVNFLVSTADGTDSYTVSAENVSVQISEEPGGRLLWWPLLLLPLIIGLLYLFIRLRGKKHGGRHMKS